LRIFQLVSAPNVAIPIAIELISPVRALSVGKILLHLIKEALKFT